MTLPRPRLSLRGSARYSFAELYLARGPQAIGVTGDNSLPTLIGRTWALVLGTDRRLRLYQRAETTATWAEQTTLLPPLFGEVQPEGRRRFSACFDQSARVVVAYEEDGRAYVTRWDANISAYVQNVTVDGVDPAVVFDATWSYNVLDSDVLLFYLDAATRTRLLYRVQRQLYSVENELHVYPAPVVLDRVQRLPLRYQVLASDAAGDPLADAGVRVGLLSELYPYPALDRFAGAGSVPRPWVHEDELLPYPDAEAMAATPVASGSAWQHVSDLFTYPADPPEPMAAVAGVPAETWKHTGLLFTDAVDPVAMTGSPHVHPNDWQHVLSLFTVDDGPDGMGADPVTSSAPWIHKEV